MGEQKNAAARITDPLGDTVGMVRPVNIVYWVRSKTTMGRTCGLLVQVSGALRSQGGVLPKSIAMVVD